MLGYKLQLLKNQFEQAEMRLLSQSVAGTTLKKLERVYSEIKRLEAEFRCGRYYPDLLDEQIVIIREELRQIPADPVETGSTSQPPLFSLESNRYQLCTSSLVDSHRSYSDGLGA
jgi:hypothetical protein